jgi:poly-gamma-glutamate synthesis protein (capsule biosynthesis protein)
MTLAGRGRVIVFSFGAESSGITRDWAAAADRPGVNLLPDLSDRTVRRIAGLVHDVKRDRDIVVASIHWGQNWGYRIPDEQTAFAHKLIDEAGVDVIHGHSSHHPKGIEVYNDRPIIYGCGDFLNDYEGIGGYEEFRPDLALMYFVSMDPSTGRLVRFDLTPTRVRRFQVRRASKQDAEWLRDTLNREGEALGTRLELNKDATLSLRWEHS